MSMFLVEAHLFDSKSSKLEILIFGISLMFTVVLALLVCVLSTDRRPTFS